jgi:branched-chain amino acid transport system permease protein
VKTWLILLIRAVSIFIGVSACFGIDWMSHNQVIFGPGLHLAVLPTNEFIARIFALAGLYVTLAVSLNLINGITGQFSVGHAAFYMIGAYVAGFTTVTLYGKVWIRVFGAPFQLVGLPWLVAMMVLGAIGAGIAGFVVGLPSLRLRGDYLAIVTLGFGEIIRIIVENIEPIGGSYGLNVAPKFQLVWLVWLLAFGCIAVCRNLLRSAHGLQFLAVREDEVAAAAMGVAVTRVKVVAFILGAMFAGAAGALLAHYEGFISPTTFAMDVSFLILTMVVLGGSGSITGATITAILLSWLPEFLRNLQNSDGSPMKFSHGAIIASLIATGVGVALIKRTVDRPVFRDRVSMAVACFIGAFLFKIVVGSTIASLIAAGVGVALIIRTVERPVFADRALRVVACVIGGLDFKIVAQMLFDLAPGLREPNVEAGQIRQVVFAVTLIVIMLLRPQGIFGHHEFSLAWLRSVGVRVWHRIMRRREVPA